MATLLARPDDIAHRGLALALPLSLLAAAPTLQADELSELKALVQDLQARIVQLEARAAASDQPVKAAPAAAPPTQAAAQSTPVAPIPASRFDWKIYGRGDIAYTRSLGATAAGQAMTTERFNQGQMVSRIGISGSWSFNADYKALFGLESGINLFGGTAGGGTQNNPNGNVLFNRGASVGLASRLYGTVEAGTLYMAPFWVLLGADQASARNYGLSDLSAMPTILRPEPLGRYLKEPVTAAANVSKSSSMTGNNSGTALFYANALRYRTVDLAGLSGELSYSMGQQAAGSSPLRHDGRAWAFNLLYKQGPLFAGYSHMDYLQVNDVATSGTADWQQRHQLTDIVGARYRWDDLTLGGAYIRYRVSAAGGYRANAFGVSGAYDLGKHRLEASLAQVDYAGANQAGAFGSNLGDGKGEPQSRAIGLGYLYSLEPNLTLYGYYSKVLNNPHARLGLLQFRGDNQSFGFDPSEWTAGMFFVF